MGILYVVQVMLIWKQLKNILRSKDNYKKTIVEIGGLRVVGEIDEKLIEKYVGLTIPQGVQVIIGDNIEDIIRQIAINLRQQGNRDLELNDSENFKKCLKD